MIISLESVVYHFGSVTVGENAYNDIKNKNKIYFENKWNKKWKSHHLPNSLITENEVSLKYKKNYFKFNNYNINFKLKKK